ncbi:MAG: LLM class F420-dependent oxidoreductase [Actinobacteria bacterium]|jgi:probable F420-dependent oxidoreductase|nr:LLM class F420-dependent oxidoreductase [Actinomycetota bacterium]
MSRRVKIGVQLHPQHCSFAELRSAWTAADALGADSIWVWDHFYPLYGPADGAHFEGTALLAAMAATTSSASLGLMVGCTSYRNPELMADVHRTIDHISDGRTILGIGAGWFERDYSEYGFEFGTARGRLDALEADLQRMRDRISQLTPAPVGRLPILIGGAGEKVTLRLVARYADAWNTFGPPESWSHKNAVLNEWCEREGRDPAAIERTVCINPDEADQLGAYVDAGAHHVIVMIGTPFDLTPVESLLAAAEALG